MRFSRARKCLAAGALALVFPGLGGAPATPISMTGDPVTNEQAITEADRAFWSFRALNRPAIPVVEDTASVRNTVDQFIVAALEAAGKKLAPQADPVTLIRRVTFDLTGLPPTQEEVLAFVAASKAYAAAGSTGPDPYDSLVARLLASPRYGERAAQSWLDLARFAETDGFEHDLDRKDAWQYRDWVIQALNKDLPFNQFAAYQVAGDEMSPENAVATGFLIAGPDMPDSNFQDERRHLLLNEITSTIGSVFMGLTVGCAQCHDHPYDPVSQADFYRLRAFFDHMAPLKKEKQLSMANAAPSPTPVVSRICLRGDHQRPGPVVQAAFLRIANPDSDLVVAAPISKNTGPRTIVARWLTQSNNGLFLRATMNRIWQQHFGRPLAGTPNDLGRQGEHPTHPELLDWLATELPLQKWSLKRMHTLLVTCATYRQLGETGTRSSGPAGPKPAAEREAAAEDNHLYARYPRRRLSGEEIRDALLSISGRLSLKTGGPSVRLPLPPEVMSTLLEKQAKEVSPASEWTRRSIYVFARRNLRYPLFDLFDRPDALVSCSRRSESTTATQALSMLNSEFSQEIARTIAAEVRKAGTDPAAIVAAATVRCYSRGPSDREMALGTAFLQKRAAVATFDEAVTDYCLALINASPFFYVD